MTNKKAKTIKLRVDDDLHNRIAKKAEKGFDGNISSFLRWAAVTCDLTTSQHTNSDKDSRIIALLTAIKKHHSKIGVNLNQVAKAINEKMKMSPLAFSANDLSPFRQFCNDMNTVQEMYRHIYNLLVE